MLADDNEFVAEYFDQHPIAAGKLFMGSNCFRPSGPDVSVGAGKVWLPKGGTDPSETRVAWWPQSNAWYGVRNI